MCFFTSSSIAFTWVNNASSLSMGSIEAASHTNEFALNIGNKSIIIKVNFSHNVNNQMTKSILFGIILLNRIFGLFAQIFKIE